MKAGSGEKGSALISQLPSACSLVALQQGESILLLVGPHTERQENTLFPSVPSRSSANLTS